MQNRVLFYARVKDLTLLNDISFYEQDIRVLKEMGYEVVLTNSYFDVLFARYDYIYIWWWGYALLPLLFAKVTFRKSIVAGAFHYNTPLMRGTDFKRRGFIYQILVRSALKLSDANIFVSKVEYRDVVENLSVYNPFMVYHGIDVNKYSPKKIPSTFQSSIESIKIKILMISWLEKNNIERKCIKQSIEAVCQLYTDGYDVDLQIAGRPGPGYDEFVEYLKRLEGSECVKLLGHVTETEKVSLLQDSDVFLSPTLYEGFGVAIAEALSCGCAVITSDNGAVSEVASTCALYCDPKSVVSIYDKVKFLLDNPKKIEQLSHCGSARIKNNFSYAHHFESLSSVIKTVYK